MGNFGGYFFGHIPRLTVSCPSLPDNGVGRFSRASCGWPWGTAQGTMAPIPHEVEAVPAPGGAGMEVHEPRISLGHMEMEERGCSSPSVF